MQNKAHALAAGVFVLVLTGLLLLLGAWLTRESGEQHVYEISTREAVTGLQEQAPVRLRGVDVGKVASIAFDPKVQGNVLVRMDIAAGTPITRETFATLSFQGVTGLAFVQLDDAGQPAPLLPPDDAAPPRIPLKPGLLSKLASRGEAIMEQVEQASTRISQLLSESNQKRFTAAFDNVAEAAASITVLSRNLDATLSAQFGPQRVNIPSLVRRTDNALASLQETSEATRVTITEIGQTARRLNAADGPMDRLSAGTASLAHAADAFNSATLPRINRVTEDTSRAVRQLSRTIIGINDNPQSLIFGTGRIEPGPGEEGFTPPGASK
ncbi:MlaD family protein [Ramlibacter tataouinensis]|uniref:MlaD family protein n=1 Tax=Ramlibacter tataouinensis TaxID=94132 RepID=UPI0022F40673|nr:MlaD family protein [Ramlibacter tataouinensis]WBY00266.1 MlaD family protein [Ramlibacter tataouinensis]